MKLTLFDGQVGQPRAVSKVGTILVVLWKMSPSIYLVFTDILTQGENVSFKLTLCLQMVTKSFTPTSSELAERTPELAFGGHPNMIGLDPVNDLPQFSTTL